MRSLRYLPLTFICGVHGFALFAPYLATFLAAHHFIKLRRAALVPIPVAPVRPERDPSA
jgi:hypothetical protein